VNRLRILYVASRFDYGDPARGLSFEEMNFAGALRGMGHELLAFDAIAEGKRIGRRRANRALLALARETAPDLAFFCLMTHEVKRSTIRALSGELGIPTVNWFCDDNWRFRSFTKRYAPCFSYSVTTVAEALPRYRSIGYEKVLLLPWACNRYHYRRVSDEKRWDVTFVGQPHSDRRKVVAELARRGISVECFGYGWPNGRVAHERMLEIFSGSRINLNLTNSANRFRRPRPAQIKGRLFEVPGCGGFLLTETTAQLERYLQPGRECATFSGLDELESQIRYFLEHEDERRRIELAGERRVLAEHTYDHRFGELFRYMGLA
jgi:spore maturation protein CgeB